MMTNPVEGTWCAVHVNHLGIVNMTLQAALQQAGGTHSHTCSYVHVHKLASSLHRIYHGVTVADTVTNRAVCHRADQLDPS